MFKGGTSPCFAGTSIIMNKFKVTICNKEFSLQTEEEPAYYIDLAKKVENSILGFAKSSDSVTVFSASVLSALQAFDEAKKANDSIDNIRTQIKEYVDDACQARNERDDAVKKVDELNAKISALENEISILKMQQNIDAHLSTEPNNKNNTARTNIF